MNSNYGKSSQQKGSSASLNNFNFDFDLGIGSNRPKSLNDQKNPNSSSSYSYSSSTSSYSSAQWKPSWQPNKTTGTHQPAPIQSTGPGLSGGPTSMVGDIFGKSWGSTQPSGSNSTIGIVDKNPNLFGDLVSNAMGQGSKSSGAVPLKNAAPASKVSGATSSKSSFSMGNMTDSLPKTSNTVQNSGGWGSSGNLGGYPSGINSNSMNANRSSNLGGPSMKSMATGSAAGSGISSNKDPFSSLSGFGSKQSDSLNSAGKGGKNNTENDSFGDFQDASKPSSTKFPSGSSSGNNVNFTGSNSGFDINIDDFGIPAQKPATSNQNPAQASGGDPLDMLFQSSSASAGSATTDKEGFGGQPASEMDDWGFDSEFGGGGNDGATTELEGLPPPPAGISGSTAKNKGMDNYKQGQFADAIKWLSWAVILLEKAGDNAGTTEVLSCRASCYKEVGEYKKAVADCSKVLEQEHANVSILVQRALLYESMEKYKLGAEDLRTVLKIDPGNRIARSTIHRLNKLAD